MRSIALPVLAFVLSTVFTLAIITPGCGLPGTQGKLPDCKPATIQTRWWCNCVVNQTTRTRADQGLPPACRIPFSATRCADKNAMGGFVEVMDAIGKYSRNYSAPGGFPPYVMIGDNAFWLSCPAKDENGATDCTNGQPGNPWPGQPYVDLDAINPITPGLSPQGFGGSAPGTGGSGVGGDCAICLMQAPCDGLTSAQCLSQHCAAVCPLDSTDMVCAAPNQGGGLVSDCAPSGADCSSAGAVCCMGACQASDVSAYCP